jgi:excisionase family DNA binding protein
MIQQKEISENTYYTAKEAAKILRVGYQTLLKHASQGLIPSKKIGLKVLIPRAEVDPIQKAEVDETKE